MPKGLCGMRKNVLVVAQQIELRARIVRVLHSAGYGTELAGNQKRALELAARKDIQAAIVVQSRDLAGLGRSYATRFQQRPCAGAESSRAHDRALACVGPMAMSKAGR